jgi:hypothetical protein
MRNPLSMSRDDILGSLGLQTRRSPAGYLLPALGMFGVGLLAGAGLGMLFAPRTGREIRRELGTRVSDMTTKLKTKMRRTKDEVAASLEDARDSLYGGNSEYSPAADLGMDSGRRTGLTNTST